MKFFNLLKSRHVRSSSSSSSSRAWPSCHQPKTLSFRVTTTKIDNDEDNNNNNNNHVVDDVVLKNINSALVSQTPESFFTESPDSASFSTTSELSRGMDPIEAVIRGLRSDRLFFDPDESSCILETKPTTTSLEPFKNSVVLTIDSENPHVDFRKSMEEMVETLGVEDWETLEDLLCWYLQANTMTNHEYIMAAFVDLLFDLAVPNSPCSQDHDENLHSHSHSRPSSPLSFYNSSSSPSSSCSTLYCIKGEVEEEGVGVCSSFFSLAQLNN